MLKKMDGNFDLKKIEEVKESLAEIESKLKDKEFEKCQQRTAIKKSFCEKKFIGKMKLLMGILLEKMGRIPYYPVDEFRADMEIRQEAQMLRNKLALLECRQKKSMEISKVFMKDLDGLKKEKDINLESLKNGYIAVVVNSLDRGGLEQVVYFLVQELVKRNILVKVLCLDSGGMIAEKLANKGIEVQVFDGKGRSFKSFIKRNPPILVNTHYVKKYIKFLYRRNIPIVEVIHNMYVFYCKHVINIERQNEKYYTKMIAVSEVVKETYCSRIANTNKITVIGNAAQLREQPKKNRDEARDLLKIPKQAYVILNVGSIDPRKNQLGMVAAFDIISQIREETIYLVLAGNIQDRAYNERLKNAIDGCKQKENIILLPYYERIRELYQMADVFLIDSYYEGWSIAATEALYEGLPIVHSMCGSALELTAKGKYGIVVKNPAGDLKDLSNSEIGYIISRGEYYNTEEVVEGLLKIVDNKEYWNQCRLDIISETRKKFSEEKMVNEYLGTFVLVNENVGDKYGKR